MTIEDRSEADVRKVAEGLKRKIREAGLTYKEVEERAGMGRDYLRQVLRGSVKLRFGHVLTLLQVLGVPPADFFAEVYGPAPAAPPAPLPSPSHDPSFDELLRVLQRSFTNLQSALSEMHAKEGRGAKRTADVDDDLDDAPPGRLGSKAS
ncbi:MAG TPA: helix-turn-helix transcriptional regulator [Thermoanaerobaculia bacterium]|nr:helix-turn-helix transcriptional regulator [Thermoanaerobaculia bacterium]